MMKFLLLLLVIGILAKGIEAIMVFIAANPVLFGVGLLVTLLLCIGITIAKWSLKRSRKKRRNNGIYNIEQELRVIDSMNGHQFEYWCASLLRRLGYTNVQVTKASNDQGADIIASGNGLRYAIQCKCYSGSLGNRPIQEVVAGRQFYKCNAAMVMTNSHFTSGGVAAASATDVRLVDREKLIQMMSIANELHNRSEKAAKKAASKREAKRYVKQNYSEEQLANHKAQQDSLSLSYTEMMEIDDCIE